MALCRQYQIPHSRFLSWPEADQDKALAYERLLNATCSKCGTEEDIWITRDPDTGAIFPILPPPLEPEQFRCFGCEITEKSLADVPSDEKGVYVRLVPPTEGKK